MRPAVIFMVHVRCNCATIRKTEILTGEMQNGTKVRGVCGDEGM